MLKENTAVTNQERLLAFDPEPELLEIERAELGRRALAGPFPDRARSRAGQRRVVYVDAIGEGKAADLEPAMGGMSVTSPRPSTRTAQICGPPSPVWMNATPSA